MAVPLTEQQSIAVSRREVSIVLSSGAGCGKTHVLTERYLAHLREGAEVGQVVAITFTDRAARQMRERIRRAVLQELRAAEGAEEVERWDRHLRGLETAQISTIHAFCGTLLRQHAIEAGLDPQFDVFDDVMAANLRSEAHADCLQDLLTSTSTAGGDLRELVLLYGWRPTVAAVAALTASHDEAAWRTWLQVPPEETARRWREAERRALLPAHVAYLVAASPGIARCLWLLRRTPCLKPAMQASVRRVLEETPRLAAAPDLEAAVASLLEAARVGKDRGSAWPSEEVYERVKDALQGYRDDLTRRLALFLETPEGVADAVTVGHRFLRVASAAVEAYRVRKRLAGAVDFQDLLVMARNLLRELPDAREALQRRFRFLLVDELQDTDPIQMEVVEALCGGGLTAGKLFAVGDHKQSIYRFRGADVSLFQRLRQSMPHDGRLGLTLNFRSQPALLHFVNALFAGRLEEYEPLRPHHAQVNPGPCVEFAWSPRAPRESVNEARAREADALARRIAAMCRGEELVAQRDGGTASLRRVRPGDVVLLFRSLSHVAIYENALRKHGLDYYLVGGRAFFAQQEIYDLLNLLRALENPQDAVSLAGTLRSPFCCLSDEALFLLARHREGPWAALRDEALLGALPEEQQAAARRARDRLDRWQALKDRLPIAGLLGRVFADSGYDAALQFEFLGDRKLANLWKLQEMARAFDRTGLFGLAEFIARLGDLVQNQPREEQAATQPENADVVRLMTIHQAKGLEFPVVFVPDLAARTGGPQQPVAHWDPRLGCVARPPADEDPPPFPEFGTRLSRTREAIEEWHEDLRTLYVACTRAQDYLVLSASLNDSLTPETAWMLLLAERFDLANGDCQTETPPGESPRVRVLDTAALPLPAVLPRAPTQVAEAEELAGAAAVAPVPARLDGVRLLTVAQVERLLAPRPRGRAPLRPADVAHQFDAEDGSDRRAWPLAGERVTPASPTERLVRAVLERWDFRDADGWRPLLADLREQQVAEEGAGSVAERLLARFAAAPLRRELARAGGLLRGVEYLLELPGEGLLGESHRLVVLGTIDALWREDGPRLLEFTFGKREPRSLFLAGCAVRQQGGEWPVRLTLYNLETGTAVEEDGGPEACQQALSRVRAGLSDALRKTLPA